MLQGNSINHLSISNGTIIRFLLVLLGFFLIWVLRDLVLVVLTSIVVASFIELATPLFRRLRINRIFGVVLIYLIVILFLAGTFYLFAPLLITEIYNFAVFLSKYAPGVDFLNYFSNQAFSGAKDIVTGISDNLSITTLLATSKAFIENLSGGFFTTLSVVFGSIFNLILIVIISFYLSIQEKGIEKFLRVILPIKHEEYVINLWERTSKKIGLWMRGQLLVAFLVTILTYLVLSILGVPYALLLSLLAGGMELVPYGFFIALVPAVAFTYLSSGLPLAIMVLGAFVIINQFETFLFTPLIIKRVVGLSPLIVILAILIGFKLAGIWGLILSIPGAVLFVEIMDDLEKNKILKKAKNES